MVDFTMSGRAVELAGRTKDFVAKVVIPFEERLRPKDAQLTESLRQELIGHARAAGLLAPHVAKEWGGLGLDHGEMAAVFRAAGYSPLGPIAMNCFAPDEGNMMLLQKVASGNQKKRWLRRLASGEIRSCFMMTEPNPGAGSDPSLLRTTATKSGGDYLIDGEKIFITGAIGASVAIIMAKVTSDDVGPTMFLTDMDAPGITIERRVETIDESMIGGHSHVRLCNVRVPGDQVLGEAGKGLQYAQVRLAPARLTHCMRWTGAADRAHDIACEYALDRSAFGLSIIDHEGVGFMLADNVIDLQHVGHSIDYVAWLLDRGAPAGQASSIAKVFCSEALYRVADRCVQVMGGLGVSRDTVVEQIFREIRAFRIYDGPSEVHRWSIAKAIKRDRLGGGKGAPA